MMKRSQAQRCRCGHDRAAHRHYRRGSDCALCGCPHWSPDLWLVRIFRRRPDR